MEVMDKVGLVVPMQMQMVGILAEELTNNLVTEFQEIEAYQTIQGVPILWNQASHIQRIPLL